MKSEIKCAYRVNRFQTQYWIVVRFSSNRVLQQWHESNVSINIIRIECNVTGAHTAMISPCIRYMNFRRACHQDIRYRKDRQIYLPSNHRTERYRSDDLRCGSRRMIS